jgi:hypothetical protein
MNKAAESPKRPILHLKGFKPAAPAPKQEPQSPPPPPLIVEPPSPGPTPAALKRKALMAERKKKWILRVAEMFAESLPGDERGTGLEWALRVQIGYIEASFRKHKLKQEIIEGLASLWHLKRDGTAPGLEAKAVDAA